MRDDDEERGELSAMAVDGEHVSFRGVVDLFVGEDGPRVATVEANPFSALLFDGYGTPIEHHSIVSRRRLTMVPWGIERQPQGWVVLRRGHAIPLPPRQRVHVDDDLFVVFRPHDLPLVTVRARVGDVALLDRSAEHPNHGRLGVYRGQLVVSDRFTSARPLHHVEDQGWLFYPARCEVPLRWLCARGFTCEGAGKRTDLLRDVVVGLDGAARVRGYVRPPNDRDLSFAKSLRIAPGVVEGFLPDYVRFWRELEEQAAIGAFVTP